MKNHNVISDFNINYCNNDYRIKGFKFLLDHNLSKPIVDSTKVTLINNFFINEDTFNFKFEVDNITVITVKIAQRLL